MAESGRPWEDYAAGSGSATGRPWEDYAAPAKPAQPEVSVGEDVVKSAGGGLGRGVAGTLGLGGDVGSLARAGLAKAGVPESVLERGAGYARAARHIPFYGSMASILTGPGSQEVTKAIEPYTGEFYKPQTTAGQYVSTIAEAAPSALLPVPGAGVARQVIGRGTNVLAPALGSETAGQVFAGSGYERAARLAGGVGGGLAGGKLLTPFAAPTAERQAANAILEQAGVPRTAGMITGSRIVRNMEDTALDTPFVTGMATNLAERTKTGYDKAITERTFPRAELTARGVDPSLNLPSAEVQRAGREALSDKYKQLTGANQLKADPQLITDMRRVEDNYLNSSLATYRGTGHRDIVNVRDDITEHLIQNQGKASGEWYQNTRSALGTEAQRAFANKDAPTGRALKEMRTALDTAMERGLSPADAAAWRDLNMRYSNAKKIENAVATGGEHLSPAAVAAGVRAGRAGDYGAAKGNLDPLAKAGATVLKDLPSSGTAQRMESGRFWTAIPKALAIAPVVSRPGQAYLSNQVAPQRFRDLIANAILQQAISQQDRR